MIIEEKLYTGKLCIFSSIYVALSNVFRNEGEAYFVLQPFIAKLKKGDFLMELEASDVLLQVTDLGFGDKIPNSDLEFEKQLDNNKKIIVYTITKDFEYHSAYISNPPGGHVIVIYGYDDEFYYLYDSHVTTPGGIISLDTKLKRNVLHENAISSLAVNCEEKSQPKYDIVKTLHKAIRNFLNPEKDDEYILGVDAIRNSITNAQISSGEDAIKLHKEAHFFSFHHIVAYFSQYLSLLDQNDEIITCKSYLNDIAQDILLCYLSLLKSGYKKDVINGGKTFKECMLNFNAEFCNVIKKIIE